MRRFTDLYLALDRAKGTRAKTAALAAYFGEAPAEDAAWAVHFLSGRKVRRAVTGGALRDLVAEETGLPAWLVAESYDVVGDLAETIALLLPGGGAGTSIPLHRLVAERTLVLPALSAPDRSRMIRETWAMLDSAQRFVWHKMMLGGLRVGVGRGVLTAALAEVAEVPAAEMSHRLSGRRPPTAAGFRDLLRVGGPRADAARPYPFFLASPLDGAAPDLGPIDEWQVEWKYDGIRAQLIRRPKRVVLWSRGDELLNEAFPELVADAAALPAGTVLDGEIVAWGDERPLGFAVLQPRLNRRRVELAFWEEIPVAFLAFDLLEGEGGDRRELPLAERRRRLEDLFASRGAPGHLRLAPLVAAASWDDVAARRDESRGRHVEGVMLKRRASPYRAGRTRGDWWKWKIAPHTVDAVLIAAQRGHGRRAGLFTDFTFGVWQGEELVPVTKAYSGLTDAEFRDVNRFIRGNSIGRHGPVRRVRPALVFEIGFEGIQASPRHRSGIALRFPRMHRWRRDKRASEADSIDDLRRLLAGAAGGGDGGAT